MKFASIFLFGSLLGSIGIGLSEEETKNSKETCQTLIECLQDAVNEHQKCDSIQEEINRKWPPKYNEKQQTIAELANKTADCTFMKREMQISCLQASLENTTVISCEKHKRDHCAGVLASYIHVTRKKRQIGNIEASADVNVSVSVDGNTPNLSDAKEEQKLKKEAAVVKHIGEVKERQELHNDLNECRKSASEQYQQCKKLAKCCSESWPCDNQYQASRAAVDCATLNLNLHLERRLSACTVHQELSKISQVNVAEMDNSNSGSPVGSVVSGANESASVLTGI